MENNTNKYSNKNTSSSLATQVKKELQNRGYATAWSETDFLHFKRQCKNAFNKAVAIAKKFIEEAEPQQNDFSSFIF